VHITRYAENEVEVREILDASEKVSACFVAISRIEPRPEGFGSEARAARFVVWIKVTDEDHMVSFDAARLGYL
jgi:hypothetical protein